MNLESTTLTGSSGEYTRQAWFLSAPRPKRICIFLDGEFYVHRMDAPSRLEDLRGQRRIPAAACIFISHVGSQERHADYTCNGRYARFIAEDVLAWVRNRFGVLDREDHLIAGASLSGLEAAYIALRYPQTFSAALCQSGSFWWNGEWLKGHAAELPAPGGKFWISVGSREVESGVSHPPTGLRQEVTQVTASENFVQVLRKKGIPVNYHLYQGGHEIKHWAEEFSQAVSWLWQGSGTDPSASPSS
jgi:enterochelin esterase family protein